MRGDFVNPTGTMFRIQTLTGRDISQFSIYGAEREVILLPFTSFVTDRIEARRDYEKVWLTEIESPSSTDKNVLLWVDDEPRDNMDLLRQLEERRGSQMEILRVTSTRAAEAWMREFAWLFSRTNREIKVVTDMSRLEDTERNEINQVAGLSLIRLLQWCGYSTKVLIYCYEL